MLNYIVWAVMAGFAVIVITIVSFFIRDMLREGKE